MEERATRRPLRSARARGSKGPKTKRAAAALLHKWCTWIRTETPGCLPAGWEAGSRCGQKNPHPLFRPTDAPKSNNSTHQSAWDWSVVALTRVVETRSAILAVPPTVQSPAPPVGKSVLAAPRCPPRHRSREPPSRSLFSSFVIPQLARARRYEETNAILNLQPQYQEIAKYTRGHCSSSLPSHLARAFDLKSPALYSLARTFDVLLRE